MHLMFLNNLGYSIITLFFIILFFVAYTFRKRNNTSDELLGITDYTSYVALPLNLGIIEFTVLTFLGACFGFSGFYFLAIAQILAYFFWARYYTNMTQNSFIRYINSKSVKVDNLGLEQTNLHNNGSATIIDKQGLKYHIARRLSALGFFSMIIAVFQLTAYLSLSCLSIIITTKIFQALLGWSFFRGAFAISGFVILYSLVGGYKAIRINRIINYILVLGVLMLTLTIAFFKLDNLNLLYANLKHLALSEGFSPSYYIDFNFSVNWLSIVGILFIGITGLNVLNNKINFVHLKSFNSANLVSKIVISQLVVMCGIVAIGTAPTINHLGGREVITYQTELPNGEIGYVVRAIEDNSSESSLSAKSMIKKSPVLGIIPLNINSKTNLVDPELYNYMLSGVVTVEHYLPKELKFLVVLMIVALFITSLSKYLILSSRVFIKDIVEPLDLFSEYTGLAKLWLSRATIIIMCVMSLLISYALFPDFDLMTYLYILLSVFLAPFFIILVILSVVNR